MPRTSGIEALRALRDSEYGIGLPVARCTRRYILFHMKQILVEIDDRCARDLERVAPVKKRMRAEFIRLAVRCAIDVALDRATADAYLAQPFAEGIDERDVAGWDAHNALAKPPLESAKRPRRSKPARRVA